MAKQIAIIGAGIAGLSAGIFGRLNGFRTAIYEMSPKAGGVCSSWERDGYSVNGSVHWLVGSAPGTDLYDLWYQLGAIEESAFYNHSSFLEYRNLDGHEVHFYTDLHKLKKHFLELSPADKDVIEELIHAVETMANSQFPMDKSFELMNPWDWIKAILANYPFVVAMTKYNVISIREFAARFRSPVLRKVFEQFWNPEIAMTFLLMQMGYAYKGTAGYPLGGAGKFVERLERRYRNLGGELYFGARVTKILVEDGKAIGLELNGTERVYADYIIAAADGHTVLFELLGEQYLDETTKQAYRTLTVFPAIAYFSAGIRRTFEEGQPSIMGTNVPLPAPLQVGGYKHERATFQIYNFDPTLAPKGCTLITAIVETDFDSWQQLYERSKEAYQAERQRIAEALVEALEANFGNIKGKVDFTDLATPITFKHWTGNYKGSYEGWLPTPEAAKVRLPTHFKTLQNFYVAGHWVTPGGGMPPAAYSGRDAIQLICRDEKVHFNTVG